jgi:CRP-like cAMP-binding protein
MRWTVFEQIDPVEVQQLLRLSRRRRFRKGESVLHEGDPADSLHLIDSGYVSVRVTTPAGDVATLQMLGPGDHFGDLVMIAGDRRSATVTAASKLETLELRYADLEGFRREHPAFGQALLVAVAQQLRRTSASLLESMYLPAAARIARRLGDLRALYGSDLIPLTQDDLAGLSGATRQTVNQVMTDLRQKSIVELSRGKVRILDPTGLERAMR